MVRSGVFSERVHLVRVSRSAPRAQFTLGGPGLALLRGRVGKPVVILEPWWRAPSITYRPSLDIGTSEQEFGLVVLGQCRAQPEIVRRWLTVRGLEGAAL
jgi:hypothetical protein